MLTKLKMPLGICLLLITFSIGAFAQQTGTTAASPAAASPEAQLLRALLDEVRQLRAAMQRTNLNLHRAQMLTGQLARQQNRVNSLAEEIEQLKIQVQQSLDTSRDEDEMKEMEASIGEADPQTRAPMIQTYNSMKRTIARQRELARTEAERMQARQTLLENTFRMEQAKLGELQEQLDAIDREFERQMAETRKMP